jgi:hypothetical protein
MNLTLIPGADDGGEYAVRLPDDIADDLPRGDTSTGEVEVSASAGP